MRVLLVLLFACSGAHAASPEAWSLQLDHGPPESWQDAIVALMEDDKGIPPQAVASVLRRETVLSAAQRLRLVGQLGTPKGMRDPRVLHYLFTHAQAGPSNLGQAALAGLLKSRDPGVVPLLARLHAAHPAWRREISLRLDALNADQVDDRAERGRDRIARSGDDRPREAWLDAALWGFIAASALLGLVLFLWGFRLLQLLRLLRGLAPARIASAALGTNVFRGLLQKAETGLLKHPVSDEACLYYAGAERAWPGQRFRLVDDSGELLVDPRGAVLLSADDVLVEGEPVRVLGYLAPSEEPGSGGRILRKDKPPRTLAGRMVHFLVQGVLGFWDRSGRGRALFSDPRRCFWIWDDADAPPLASGWPVARMFLVFLLAGAWILTFALVALGLLDATAARPA